MDEDSFSLEISPGKSSRELQVPEDGNKKAVSALTVFLLIAAKIVDHVFVVLR